MRRIPLVGSVYNVVDRFVGLLDQQPGADIGAMTPVWCFFGGDGAAVLGLAPSRIRSTSRGDSTAQCWCRRRRCPSEGLAVRAGRLVRPARIGVETLTAVHVSMGITPPTPAR
jgi:uncharacterized membrane protein